MHIRVFGEDAKAFPIKFGSHQGFALNPRLFALAMDELTKNLQKEVSWYHLFVDDIALIDEEKRCE